MKLFATPGDFHAQQCLIAAQYAGKSVTVDTKGSEKSVADAAIKRFPILQTDKGCVSQSGAIMKFLAAGNAALTGADAFQTAEIDSWIAFSASEVETPAMSLTYPVIGWMDSYDAVNQRASKLLTDALTVIENHLKMETFLCGRAITLADIALATALVLPMKISLGDKERKPFPCVVRWFTTCVSQPEFAKVLGPVTLPKKATVAKPKEEPKKEEPKAAKKEAAEEEAAPAPKAKNPLELLPKSSLVLDSWKRQYSNATDLYKGAMPWFWENLDKEGYSVFLSEYNYNDELKIDFQVSNLVGGFMQRCDEIRKYAFGVMNIIGQNGGPMEIRGCWLMRGPDMNPLLESNPDAEYHTWTKVVDFTDEKKKEIEDMWCAEKEVYGKPILDSKIFK